MTKSRHRRPGPAVQPAAALILASGGCLAAALTLLLVEIATRT